MCDRYAIWKIARSNVHTGGEEILQAYLAPQKYFPWIEAPNVLVKCAAEMLRKMKFNFKKTIFCSKTRL
ncbi:hypothetical protein CNR22_23910 [Sphingobacteriaceae bacterium]|nr:hypothetical protein CNR22_23910 [Sphingobacteriaceae bacterium]